MHTFVRPLAQEPSALNATTHHNKDFMLHVLPGIAEGTTHNTGTRFQQQCTHFTKIARTLRKYSRQKGDKKQTTYRGSTNIRCHCTKFSRHGDLGLGTGICALPGYRYSLTSFQVTHESKQTVKQINSSARNSITSSVF
jgi:hypothetical protein